MTPKGLETYRRTSVQTADRRQIITMLYEGLIGNLNAAANAIEAGDTETRTAKIRKTLDIIQFLGAALDFNKGGEISRNLSNLYDYARDMVTLGNIKGDVSKLREVIDLFNIVLDGWRQICDGAEIPANIPLTPPGHEPTVPVAPPPAGASSEGEPQGASPLTPQQQQGYGPGRLAEAQQDAAAPSTPTDVQPSVDTSASASDPGALGPTQTTYGVSAETASRGLAAAPAAVATVPRASRSYATSAYGATRAVVG